MAEAEPRPDPSAAREQASPATRGSSAAPTVVAIGASAGGLTALKELFRHVPDRTELAWVVVVHLSPGHESHLADLLQRSSRLPVQQVRRSVRLRPNRVYVIPPGANLDAIDTHLRLSKLEEERRERAPIDHFFRTLAESHDGQAVGVVLTGTGSDGTLGLRQIKDRGGLTIAQSPEEAEYDGMPRSAIISDVVDLVLPLREMPGHIVRFARTHPRVPVEEAPELPEDVHRVVQKILAQIRSRTGHDFTGYKRSTILRRIARRMQLHQLESLSAYLSLVRGNGEEARQLFDELLINVTEFFRDPEAFERLATTVIPTLFDDKGAQDRVRVWSVGCATGEEAYSLAMVLLEEAERREVRPELQIFASDLHEDSLRRAREGIYPESIEASVSADRLKRFFVKENGGYRIRRSVREMVVFAPHNVLKDPPFSHMDLIACRNVLIYLQRELQEDVLEVFHYALRPGGYLMVGASETVDRPELYVAGGKGHFLYRRRDVRSREAHFPLLPLSRGHHPDREEEAAYAPRRPSYGEVHAKLVERYAPPSILVTESHEVVHYSAHAGRYLQLPGGEPTTNVFKLVREPLGIELRAALHTARETGEATRTKPIAVHTDHGLQRVVARVRAAEEPELKGFFLIIFDEAEPPERAAPDAGGNVDATVRELDAELELTRQRLRAVIEEYESSQEEMQASNEELQSMNEELRSTLEELETSKEELQSMNEELTTLNEENRHRVDELSQLTGDLQNLLSATDIATLFLDRERRIVRFTPRVGELFNIRLTDRGRPLTDLTHRLGYPELADDARQVLDRLVPVEREVESDDDRCYLTRVLPYRSAEHRIDGVVITFIDITERRRMEEELRRAKESAERSSLVKSRFLSTMSHELRTPLTAVIGLADLMETEVLGPMTEGQKKHLNTIKAASWHLVSLIDEILTFSRADAGKETAKLATVDIAEVARGVVGMLAVQAQTKHVTLRLHGDEARLLARTDIGKLRQILTNLVGNALKFTENGGVDVDLEASDHALTFRVRDSGRGIPAERLEDIFEPFVQVEEPGGRTPGTGLGLSVARRLARLMGGDVSVESVDGTGSTFTVTLPRIPPDDDA